MDFSQFKQGKYMFNVFNLKTSENTHGKAEQTDQSDQLSN